VGGVDVAQMLGERGFVDPGRGAGSLRRLQRSVRPDALAPVGQTYATLPVLMS
jgi:hypothetical protein